MSHTAPETDLSLDTLMADLVDEFTERLNGDEKPEIEEYVKRCPQGATMLRQVLSVLLLMHGPEAKARIASGVASFPLESEGELGDFRIFREIGRGGMGVVYQAEQISLGRPVALKVLPFAALVAPKQLQRFQNEARAAASLEHPNIVHVHAVGCERGVHYYAMQFIEGRTLAQVVGELRQLSGIAPQAKADQVDAVSQITRDLAIGFPVPSKQVPQVEFPIPDSAAPPARTSPSAETKSELQAEISSKSSSRTQKFFRSVAQIGIQAAEALEYAHQMGVVHRDIKPSNLMVDAHGHLWITDFGLALTRKDAGLTMTGDALGTLRYMSPEQASGEYRVLDGRTDVYSLGVTLYELITLQPAFGGEGRQLRSQRITKDEPRRPRQANKAIPKDLETIILKSMAKEPQARYATAQTLADDLQRFLEDQPIRARRPSLVERSRRWARHHRPFVWSAAVLLLAVAIAAGVFAVKRGAMITEVNLHLATATSFAQDGSDLYISVDGSTPIDVNIFPPFDFEDVPVGQSVTVQFTLTNVSQTDTLTGLVASKVPAPFSYQGGPPTKGKYSLGPGQSCTFTLTFTPTTKGTVASGLGFVWYVNKPGSLTGSGWFEYKGTGI